MPIYKSGNKNECANYRPISVLYVINTVFEKLISRRMNSFLNKFDILSDVQHGFRPGRSTSSAAPTVAEIVNNALNDNRLVAGIFIDLRKAFDTVDHVILLDKMERYGFRGHVSNFFRSYLSARCQKVIINNVASQSRPVIVGVPQGSVWPIIRPIIVFLVH